MPGSGPEFRSCGLHRQAVPRACGEAKLQPFDSTDAMKHGSSNRRARSRGNGKRHPSVRGQNFESNGPDVKIRGTAQQVLERYLALARDATSAGDRVAAEGYFQHAEHYFRLLNPESGGGQPSVHDRGGRGGRFGPAPAPADFSPASPAEGEGETEGRTPQSVAAPSPQPEAPAEVPVAEPAEAPRQRRPRSNAEPVKPVDLGT